MSGVKDVSPSKVTQDRRKFFERLAKQASAAEWRSKHAKDISEAPVHIKLRKFQDLQANEEIPASCAHVRNKLVERRKEVFELLARSELQTDMRSTPSPDIVKVKRAALLQRMSDDAQSELIQFGTS